MQILANLSEPCRSLHILTNRCKPLQILTSPYNSLRMLTNPHKSLQFFTNPCIGGNNNYPDYFNESFLNSIAKPDDSCRRPIKNKLGNSRFSWVLSFLSYRRYLSLAPCLLGCLAFWLAPWLPGCLAPYLSGSLAAWLPGFLAPRLPGQRNAGIRA